LQNGAGSELASIVNEGDAVGLTTGFVPLVENINVGAWTHLLQDGAGGLIVHNDNLFVLPGTGATHLGKAEDAPHTTGDVGVMSLAVRQDTATALAANNDYIPLIVDSTGRLHTNVGAIVPGTAATNLGKAEDAIHASGDVGVMSLAVRQDTLAALAANGDYIPITTDSLGRVNVFPGGASPAGLGKAEDAAHASGDVGVMALAVRQDTMAALAANNDYIPLTTDSLGRLRIKESGMATIALSGSTRGRPIQITGTNSAGAVTIHTATTTAGEIDRVFIFLTNTSTSAVTVTFEFGTTGVGNELDIVVPANETVMAINGAVIGGAATDVIEAYATTGSVVNVIGRVERLS
jgi:hypothetical protein